MNTECTIICHPKPYSDVLFYTSWIFFIASVYGTYKKIYDLSIYTGLLWLSSIHYWNNPSIKLNYYLDAGIARSGIIYHLLRAPDCPNYKTFYAIFNTGLVCYLPSRYFFLKQNYLASTIYHAGLHLITGVSVIYLYSKTVKPLSESYLLDYYKKISTFFTETSPKLEEVEKLIEDIKVQDNIFRQTMVGNPYPINPKPNRSSFPG